MARATASISALLKFNVTGSPGFSATGVWAHEFKGNRAVAGMMKALAAIE
jgi:hypothetical protein